MVLVILGINLLKTMAKQNCRLRFTYEDDLVLLNQILAVNPIANPEGWVIVQQHLMELTGKQFSIKTIKNHLYLLLQQFLKKQQEDTKKSGIEEVYSEKMHLLQEISDITQNSNSFLCTPKKKSAPSKEKQISELGKQIRDKIAHPVTDFDVIEEKNNFVMEEHSYGLYGNDLMNTSLMEVEIESQDENNDNIDMPEFPARAVILSGEEALNVDVTTVGAIIKDVGSQGGESSSKSQEVGAIIKDVRSQAGETSNKSQENTQAGKGRKVLVPSRKRINDNKPLKKNALDYLKNKNERENEIRIKELEHEKEKLQLEREKLGLEKEKLEIERQRLMMEQKSHELEVLERQQKIELENKRFELDLMEKKNLHNLIASQQKIIDKLSFRSNND